MRKVAALAFGIISLLSFEVAAKDPYPCPLFKNHKTCVTCQTGCRTTNMACLGSCVDKIDSKRCVKGCISELNGCLDGCTR